MRSLERRLHLGLTLSLVALIGAAWWLGHAALHHTADAFVQSRLEHDAEGLVGALRLVRGAAPDTGTLGLTPVYSRPYSGHYFVVVFPDGQLIRSRSLWDQGFVVPALAVGETRIWRLPGPSGQALLAWAGGYRIRGQDIVVAVAEDLNPLSAELVGFERWFAAMAIGGLLLSLLTQRFIVRRAFAKLAPIYRDIERLERGQTVALSERVPREILPLVRKLNRLLALLAQRLKRSRAAAGNLAHALKGPLGLLRQQLEDPALGLPPTARANALEQIERLRQIAERQLQRARLAGAGNAALWFDPDAELPTLERLLGRMHATKSLTIRLRHALPGPLPLDREDMLELLGNLLDNACKWAQHQVDCHLSTDGAWLRIQVSDDGRGCSNAELAAITERGWRLDERVSGHGLGLSIVTDIVEGYGGVLHFGTAPALGGLAAEVRLPLVHPSDPQVGSATDA